MTTKYLVILGRQKYLILKQPTKDSAKLAQKSLSILKPNQKFSFRTFSDLGEIERFVGNAKEINVFSDF